jgi:hypothetical protein
VASRRVRLLLVIGYAARRRVYLDAKDFVKKTKSCVFVFRISRIKTISKSVESVAFLFYACSNRDVRFAGSPGLAEAASITRNAKLLFGILRGDAKLLYTRLLVMA